MPEHTCLTADQIIQRLGGITVPQEGLPTIFHGLSACSQCWNAIEELRNLRSGRRIVICDPFAGFFATLITQKPRHATHRLDLAKTRNTHHGVYWLLLEEISAFLPYLEPEVGKSTLLLFELLLAEIEGEPFPEIYGLQARTSAVAAIFWNWIEGYRTKAQEELQKALKLFEKGTRSQGGRMLRGRLAAPPYLPEVPMEAQPIPEEHPHAHTEHRQGVQGGRPVIRGRRALVSTLVVTYRGGASIEDLLADFPHLRPAQIHDALSYYYDHQDEIDWEIDELASEQAVMTRFPPTLVHGDVETW